MKKSPLSVIAGTLLVLSSCASVSENTVPEFRWQETATITKIQPSPTNIPAYKIEKNRTAHGKITNFTVNLTTDQGRAIRYQYRDLEFKFAVSQKVTIVYQSEEAMKNGKVWYLKKFY